MWMLAGGVIGWIACLVLKANMARSVFCPRSSSGMVGGFSAGSCLRRLSATARPNPNDFQSVCAVRRARERGGMPHHQQHHSPPLRHLTRMSEQHAKGSRTGREGELLTALQFQQELRHVVGFREQLPIADPLASAVKRIEQNPAFAQSRLLARILEALTYQQGEFRRAEITALDAETFAMVIGLMDAYGAGTSTRAQWIAAVDAARSRRARRRRVTGIGVAPGAAANFSRFS